MDNALVFFHSTKKDRDVQRLMDELDLPPDRANLFEAVVLGAMLLEPRTFLWHVGNL